MEIREEKFDHNMVVALNGRLDFVSARDFEERLLAAIDDGVKTLVIDVSQLEYISSTGLRVFIIAAKEIRAKGGDLLFTGVGPTIKKILEISGFTKLFKVVASASDAFSAS